MRDTTFPASAFDSTRPSSSRQARSPDRNQPSGVIEAAVERLGCPPSELLAWLGPAIGPEAFEIGPEVRDLSGNPIEVVRNELRRLIAPELHANRVVPRNELRPRLLPALERHENGARRRQRIAFGQEPVGVFDELALLYQCHHATALLSPPP